MFTKKAMENAPVLLQGTQQEQAKLWKLYCAISKTPTGRKVIEAVEETYKRTGEKLPIKIGKTTGENVAFYSGPVAGVTLGECYQDYQDADVCLAHELMHHVQRLRPLRDGNITYESIQNAFVVKKMVELEAYVQDTIIRDEKHVYPESSECLFLNYYILHKQNAEKTHGRGSEKAKQYAKTELARLLWLGKNAASYDKEKPFVPPNSEEDIIYDVAEEWNKMVNKQTEVQLFKTNLKLKPRSRWQTILLLNQFLKYMQIDLTPWYIGNNINLSSDTGLTVTEEEIKSDKNSAFLKKNSAKGLTFQRVFGRDVTIQNVYAKDGKLIYDRVKKFLPTGRVAMLVKRTKEKVEQKVHSFYPDGKLLAVQNFKDGHLEGKLCHNVGEISVKAWFKAGKPSGEVSCCDNKGELISKGIYENGKLKKVIKNQKHLEQVVKVLLTVERTQ